MTVIRSTGLYHVVEHDGPFPFWVEVRTYNRAPVVGSDVRVRGFDTLERAERYMRRLTREAVAADKTLKRFLSSDGASSNTSPEPPASTSQQVQPPRRGRPPGKKKADNRVKPKPKLSERKVVFSTDRFQMVVNLSNPVAQVWVCISDSSSSRGRPLRGSRAAVVYPHAVGDHAVTCLIDGRLYVELDEDGTPMVYPNWMVAEREAVHLWEKAPDPKQGLASAVYYTVGSVEVHVKEGGVNKSPTFSLFDTSTNEWIRPAGQSRTAEPVNYIRLDNAIEEAHAYLLRNVEPASMRLIAALWESDDEKMERELREQREMAAHARREAERQRLFEQEQAELAAIAAKNKERALARGRRVLSKEEVDEIIANRVITTNPTREQRFKAMRQKYRPRAAKDQRGNP